MKKVFEALLCFVILIVCAISLHNCRDVPKKMTFNFVDLQITYKNYIVIDKELFGNDTTEYSLTLLNPITNQKRRVWVEYYLYHRVYFIGDTIR